MDILKQKKIYVSIADQRHMEAHFVMNVDMKRMKKGKRQIILYVNIVIHMINMLTIFMKIINPNICHQLYLPKENAIVVKMIYLIYV